MKALITAVALLLASLSTPLWAADSISVTQLKQEMAEGKSPIIIDVRDEDHSWFPCAFQNTIETQFLTLCC